MLRVSVVRGGQYTKNAISWGSPRITMPPTRPNSPPDRCRIAATFGFGNRDLRSRTEPPQLRLAKGPGLHPKRNSWCSG
eukprot:2412660-Heterocapsa_arctica.AAC.1